MVHHCNALRQFGNNSAGIGLPWTGRLPPQPLHDVYTARAPVQFCRLSLAYWADIPTVARRKICRRQTSL